MSEKPLHEYLDLESYDVVTGERHRELQQEAAELRLALRLVQQQNRKLEQEVLRLEVLSKGTEEWPVPAEPVETTPPDAWGEQPNPT